MNKVIFLLTCLLVASCASSPKKTPPAPMEKMETPAPAATEKMEKAKEEMMKKTPVAVNSEKITCKSGQDTRDLSVAKTDTNGCELHYTKFGKEDVVATAKNGTQHCEEVLNRIKDKLVEAKFSCE